MALPSSILSLKERELKRQTASQQGLLCSSTVWLQGMGARSRSPRSALAPSPSCSLQPWQSLRGWWGCLDGGGGAGALQGMCFLHQEPHVGHVLASSEAKEGSQQPHEWLKGWNRTWLCSLEKERGKMSSTVHCPLFH